jgi:hypothetical protein
VTWPANQWDECTIEPYPTDQVDPTVGVIIHLPSTEAGTASLRYLDLTVGRRLLDVASGVRDASNVKPLICRVGAVEPSLPGASAPQAAVAGHDAADALRREALVAMATRAPASEERRAWIVARVTRLVADDRLGAELAAVWPLPGVRASQVTADADVDLLAAACEHVEAQHLAVYEVPDPALPPAASRTSVVDGFVRHDPAPPAVDLDAEGRDVAPEDTAALVKLLGGLDGAQLALVDALAREAAAAGAGISLRYRFQDGAERPLAAGELATYRRWMIARALFHVAVAGIGYEDLRDTLYLATSRLDARQLTVPVGAVVGTLTAAEAERVARLATRLTDGTAVVTYAADGLPVVDDATSAALAA